MARESVAVGPEAGTAMAEGRAELLTPLESEAHPQFMLTACTSGFSSGQPVQP